MKLRAELHLINSGCTAGIATHHLIQVLQMALIEIRDADREDAPVDPLIAQCEHGFPRGATATGRVGGYAGGIQ